jgi:hypothetical protein
MFPMTHHVECVAILERPQRTSDLRLRGPGGSLDLFSSVQRVGQTRCLFKLV